ncbi:MAG TPA: LamG domain-containing protein [Acidimicrobiia bacterium]|nr:LamG domain-containing protein [Acidimicrobiia bacterium]
MATADYPTLALEVAFTTHPGDDSPDWEDITADFVSTSTNAGRQLELDQYQAATSTTLLRNELRTYDPEHGPTNQTVDLPGTSGNYISTPDSAAVSVTADLDIVAQVAADDWTPSVAQDLAAKWLSTGNQRSYRLQINTSGGLSLSWTTDGSTIVTKNSTASVGFTDGTEHWVRATLDVNNGASGNDVKFYTSTDGETWTQLGSTVTTAGTTSVFDSTAALQIGGQDNGVNNLFAGTVRYLEIRSSIGGAAVATFDAAGQNATSTTTPSTTTGPTGETWTLNGSGWVWTGIGSYAPHWPDVKPMRRVRLTATWDGTDYPVFSHFADSWDQDYDPPNVATATLKATDGFKVLNKKQLPTSAYAAEVAASGPKAWWRAGDPQSGGRLRDSVGGADLTTVLGAPNFGVSSLVVHESGGAIEFPTVGDGVESINVAFPVGASPLTIEFLISFTSTSAGLIFAQATGSAGVGFSAQTMSAGILRFAVSTAAGSFTDVQSAHAWNDGSTHHVVMVWQSGGTLKIYVDGTDDSASVSSLAVGSFSPATGNLIIGAGHGPDLVNSFVGTVDEVAIYDFGFTGTDVTTHHDAATIPWDGDSPSDRLTRVLDLAGWPAGDRDLDTGLSTLQSAELDQTALDHAQKVAQSDFGELFITRDGKIRFVERTGLINRVSSATFGDGPGELGYQGYRTDNSDQLIRNPVTVSRSNGVAQTARDDDGINDYLDHQFTLDGLYHDTDDLSRDAAMFLVSEYKDPKTRVVELVVKPASAPADLWPVVLGAELGDVFTVIRRPQDVGDPISQDCEIQGIRHDIGPQSWTTTFTLSPAYTGAFLQLDLTSGPGLGQLRLYF